MTEKDTYYNHTQQARSKLVERHDFLIEHVKGKLAEERLVSIRHEIACLAFELAQLDVETANHREAVADPPTQPIDIEALREMLNETES